MVPPVSDLRDLIQMSVGPGDRAVRLELRDGHAEINTRQIEDGHPLSVVVSDEVHVPYQHKTTQREQFGRALSSARRRGVDDAVLLTAAGIVAEGTAWSLFWWDNGTLHTPAADLGILPGVGRQRIMELTTVQEDHVPPEALRGHSLFLVNSVRGVVEISTFEGAAVPKDARTAELSDSFWPD